MAWAMTQRFEDPLPFTLAHTAAVLPFLRQPVVPLALVAGAMAPDLPYFLQVLRSEHDWNAALLNGISSHQFAHMLTVGMPLALVLFGFLSLIKGPIRWALPESWFPDQSGLRMRPPTGGHMALWTFHSLLIGLLTHLVWDSFTHASGWVVLHVPSLSNEPVAGIPIFRLLQHGSSLAGMSILALWYIKMRRRSHRNVKTEVIEPRNARTMLLSLVVVVPAVAAALLGRGATPVIEDALSAELFLQVIILRGGAALIASLAIYGLLWHTLVMIRKFQATPMARG